VDAWLAAHAAISWALRISPRLGLRGKPAFPIWLVAATALLTALNHLQ
jgi:hypothetical protein